jgi:uncharacterized protein involved in exopolysaccharide biosynthesis
MVDQSPNFGTDQNPATAAEPEGVDLEQVREMVGFALRATRRRLKLASIAFVCVAGLGLAIATTMPRTYGAQVKLLAQRSSAIHALTSLSPQMENVDNPTKNVAAMITRRDNLVALVKEADLVRRGEETRSAPLKLKDRVLAALFGPTSEEDKHLGIVLSLEKRLEVTTDEPTSTVTIAVDWSDPRIAYDLVTLVQKNFLEARYDSDVAVINESIDVLEEHARNELAHVDNALAEYQKVLAQRAVTPGTAAQVRIRALATSTSRTGAGVLSAPPVDPELAKALEAKRIQIRTLEEVHRQAVESLRQQLAQTELTLTPMHPSVIALRQRVETLSQPSPELTQLKSEERALMSQIVPPTVSPREASTATSTSPAASATPPSRIAVANDVDVDTQALGAGVPLPANALDRDGPLQLAQSRLASAIRAYSDAVGRTDAARVELDITRTAYKHRYIVVTPAERPKKPKKATTQIIGVGSVVGATLLALLLATLADLSSGAILESWQIRRRLKIDLLAELDMPGS